MLFGHHLVNNKTPELNENASNHALLWTFRVNLCKQCQTTEKYTGLKRENVHIHTSSYKYSVFSHWSPLLFFLFYFFEGTHQFFGKDLLCSWNPAIFLFVLRWRWNSSLESVWETLLGCELKTKKKKDVGKIILIHFQSLKSLGSKRL